jgi:tetratricopeptide (TPR) repeat protein/predicted Ser/Thr protein kinase
MLQNALRQDEGEVAKAMGKESRLAKGAALGRYVILGLIGRGGMGEVYAAFDPELDRKIAIKLLRARPTADGASSQGRTRLLREAQAIARLSHPNVVVVYDVGTFEDSVFIAMEFVEGHTLAYWLHAGGHKQREVLEMFSAAGRGLAAAHAAGIVHRDFKPENVMITKDGQVRVMDFGLARQLDHLDQLDEEPTEQTAGPAAAGYLGVRLTQTGAILGTPAYMAPEQFGGMACDARTDQFSFCVALYEGLYGARPFRGDDPLTLMANVIAGAIAEPPADARVPGWMRKLLLRGLSPAPADRHPSMTDLLAALARDPARARRRWLAAAGGIAIAAAAAAGAERVNHGRRMICAGGGERVAQVWGLAQRGAVAQAFASSGNRHAAEALAGASTLLDRYAGRWTEMYGESCAATHIRGEQSAEVLDLRTECLNQRLSSVRALTDALAHADSAMVDNAVVAAGALPALDRCADVAMLRSVIQPPDDPAKRAQVAALREQVSALTTQSLLGSCARAAVEATKVVEAAVATGYRPLEAEARYMLGSFGDVCLEPTTSIRELENAAYAAEASRHDEIAISSAAILGMLYTDRVKDLPFARHWTRYGDAVLARFPGHPILESWMATARSQVARLEGRDEDSLRDIELALALKQKVLGDEHPDVAVGQSNVGVALHDLGRPADAVPLMTRAVATFRKLGGEDNGRLAVALADLGEVLTELGRYPEAQAAIEQSLAIWRANAGPFFVGYGLLKLGELQLAEGDPRTARATLEQSLPQLQKEDAELAAEVQFALARALWDSPRDRARAIDLARQSMTALGANARAKRKLAKVESWLRERAG